MQLEFGKSKPIGPHSPILIDLSGKPTTGIKYEVQTVDGIVTQEFSGAPVFSILSENSSLKFNGVCVGGDPGSPRFPKLLIVKPESIMNSITELLSKNASLLLNSHLV